MDDERIKKEVRELLSNYGIRNELLVIDLFMFLSAERSKSLSVFMGDAAKLMMVPDPPK